MSGIVWQVPPATLIAELERHEARIGRAVAALGEMLAAKMEGYAKANAPWQDRTGEARAGLTGLSVAAADLVTVYLYHQADHGKWLEIARGGPYQIILPTLTAHYGEAMALLASILGGGGRGTPAGGS